jgi:hypothetical protein
VGSLLDNLHEPIGITLSGVGDHIQPAVTGHVFLWCGVIDDETQTTEIVVDDLISVLMGVLES